MRELAISTVAFDGYPQHTAIEEIAALGASAVEIAFIEGLGEPFDENDLTPELGERLRSRIAAQGLICAALSAYIDLGKPGAPERVVRRLRLGSALGAPFLVTNAGRLAGRDIFVRNVSILTSEAARYGMIIALEPPGDGLPSIIDRGHDAAALVREIGSPAIRVNYDASNVVSHHGGRVDPVRDFADAAQLVRHVHLKDVARAADGGWRFVAVGDGVINYTKILTTLAAQEETISASIELPLRIRRSSTGSPVRSAEVVPLSAIRGAFVASLTFVRGILSS